MTYQNDPNRPRTGYGRRADGRLFLAANRNRRCHHRRSYFDVHAVAGHHWSANHSDDAQRQQARDDPAIFSSCQRTGSDHASADTCAGPSEVRPNQKPLTEKPRLNAGLLREP